MVDLVKTAADYILENQDNMGEYSAKSHWGPEGNIYKALCCWALCQAYKQTKEAKYLKSARKILRRYEDLQVKKGAWSLSFKKNGLRFQITEKQRKASEEIVDPIITGAVLKSICLYEKYSHSQEFKTLKESSVNFLVKEWSKRNNNILGSNSAVNNLRTDPASYNFLVLEGAMLCNQIDNKMKMELKESVLEVFLGYEEDCMPLMFGYHALVLSNLDSKNTEKIVNKITKYLSNNSLASADFKGGYGHKDGLRGLCFNELHTRSTCGIIMACKALQKLSKEKFENHINIYEDALNFLKSMKDNEGGFFEFYDVDMDKKLGKGSVAQYLTIFALGGLGD